MDCEESIEKVGWFHTLKGSQRRDTIGQRETKLSKKAGVGVEIPKLGIQMLLAAQASGRIC